MRWDRVEMDLFYLKSLCYCLITLLGNGGNGKLSICHQQRKSMTKCETIKLERTSVTYLTEVMG